MNKLPFTCTVAIEPQAPPPPSKYAPAFTIIFSPYFTVKKQNYCSKQHEIQNKTIVPSFSTWSTPINKYCSVMESDTKYSTYVEILIPGYKDLLYDIANLVGQYKVMNHLPLFHCIFVMIPKIQSIYIYTWLNIVVYITLV